MPKVSRTSAQVVNHGPVIERNADMLGYRVQFVTFEVDADATPLLEGLPGGLCCAAHWGYVFKGKVTFRFGEREEVYEAGEAFYAPAGHTSMASAGTEYLQFSPAAELELVSAVMMKNLAAMRR